MESKKLFSSDVVRSFSVGAVVVVLMLGGIYWLMHKEANPEEKTLWPEEKVAVTEGSYPDDWKLYQHHDYALAYPKNIAVEYDEITDVLTFFRPSTNGDAPVGTLYPSRSVEAEVAELRKITSSRVSTNELLGEMPITRVDMQVPDAQKIGEERTVTSYMFKSEESGKTYTLKDTQGIVWEEYVEIALTIRTS